MEKEVKLENRLTVMEQKIDNLIKSVDNVSTNVNKVNSKLEEHIKCEGEKYEKLDNKYSAKWVETGVVAIITSIIIAAIVGIGTYFFKN